MATKITYYPSLTIKENAQRNKCTENQIRYYIRSNHIDRQYEAKLRVVGKIQKHMKRNPTATMSELAKATKHSINTIKRYWKVATGEEELSKIGEKIAKNGLREPNDFYATDPSCVYDLLRVERFHNNILEPFCGIGSISDVLKEACYQVESYDIVDRGYGKQGDFFTTDFLPGVYDIISNPPYSGDLTAIVSRCFDLCRNKVALLMPLRYLSGRDRFKAIYSINPPARVHVYIDRICIARNADFFKYCDPGANKEIYAWFVWDKGYKGETELKWIYNNRLSL